MIKNIILISIDALRYDCCGYQPDKFWLKKFGVSENLKTQTFDEIASKSICFTNCFSTSSYTTNAHASLFTGLYPPKHGVRPFFKFRLRKGIDTLAMKFKQHGYHTVMMSDNPVLFKYSGLEAGFDSIYTDELKAINDIKKESDAKVFSFFHFFDVHDPYLFSHNPVSSDHNQKYLDFLESQCKKYGITFRRYDHQRAYYELFYKLNGDVHFFFPLYVRGVSEFDAGRFRRFVEALDDEIDFLNSGIMVILSDHGDGRIDNDDQNKFRHEGLLFDDTIRVPLIIYHPDMTHEIKEDLFSLVDVFPTLLNLAKINISQDTFGYGLDGLEFGKQKDSIYAEYWMRKGRSLFTSFCADTFLRQRIIRTRDRKYLLNGKPELIMNMDLDGELSKKEFASNNLNALTTWAGFYDLKTDPRELHLQGPIEKDNPKSTVSNLLALHKICLLERDAVVTEEISIGNLLSRRIDDILKNIANKKVIIYGAGEHSVQLFKETHIGQANIAAIIDRDPAKWGTLINDIKVFSPEDDIKKGVEVVIISSYSFQEEIYEYLSGHPEWSRLEIISLYDSPDEEKSEERESPARQLKNLGYL